MCTPSRLTRALLPLLAALLTLAPGAHARAGDRIVYQRAGALYLADTEGGGQPVPLPAAWRVSGPLWAVSPDGTRLAWAVRAGGAPSEPSLPAGRLNDEGEGEVNAAGAAPAASTTPSAVTVYVADLPGGEPKRLFSTDALADRQGRRVTALSGTSGALSGWEAVSLGWSADGRTLYLGLRRGGSSRGQAATVAADAATGAPLVDAAGRWKALAPLTHADARALKLAGKASAATLGVLDLAQGAQTALAPEGVADVRDPALSPDGARVAFAASPDGLYLIGADGKAGAQRYVSGAVARPRWSRDGKRLLFLVPRPHVVGTGPVLYDLFVVGTPGSGSAARRLRENVEAFDIAG